VRTIPLMSRAAPWMLIERCPLRGKSPIAWNCHPFADGMGSAGTPNPALTAGFDPTGGSQRRSNIPQSQLAYECYLRVGCHYAGRMSDVRVTSDMRVGGKDAG
jgi:hypothetical protein